VGSKQPYLRPYSPRPSFFLTLIPLNVTFNCGISLYGVASEMARHMPLRRLRLMQGNLR